ncbi:efflux RND transporter periplasmic adaptor subunit [Gracilimonas tropica]|uniref:efflux RND transporter periplasmic adaptor subunit n=1 Tax=Gracilimonas tropica TaxID=454600 RepID=UPI0006857471|nr:efflux RND transporter periplasmic adaptor subunit [Gracilimonas tropica]
MPMLKQDQEIGSDEVKESDIKEEIRKTDISSSEIEKTLGIDHSVSSSKKKIFLLVISVIFLLAAAALTWFWLMKPAKTQFITEAVKRTDLTLTVSATGKLQAVNTVDVGSEISGLIDQVFVDHNDRVSAGQILARLDTERLEAEVTQAQAQLDAARASLQQAEAGLEEQRLKTQRAEQLAARDLISSQELETAQAALIRTEANVETARSQIVVSEAGLEMAQTTLRKATIRSPVNGVVLLSNIKSGQAVAASFQTPVLFTLAEDLTQMELHADIDEADIGQVREGQPATFTVDAFPDSLFPATISKVYFAPQITSGVVTYKAILTVENPRLLLRPGMTASTDITTNRVQNTLVIPNAALRFTPPSVQRENIESETVWTLENSEPTAIAVKTGLTDGLHTQLLSGNLVEGQQLLINIRQEE